MNAAESVRAAVIFDVDGVLLHLTPEEEDAFFRPFEDLHGLTGLSRDWNSYRIRNDVEAGLANGVHFIGFAADPARRESLKQAGASTVCGDHRETLQQIRNQLAV